MIIGKDELTGATFGYYILCKGLGDDLVSKQIVKDIQEFGHGDIILKQMENQQSWYYRTKFNR